MLVVIFFGGTAGIGLWLYYSKFGNLTICKDIITCKYIRERFCKDELSDKEFEENEP